MCNVIWDVRQIAKSDQWMRHARLFVCPSIRTEQLGSYWADFHKIGYFGIFRKSVEKVQVTLTSDENNGYFT
jgi:hypothetical protein